MVKKITEKTFDEEVAAGISVVDFSANWCGPCKMLAPVLEEISEELEGKIKFFNVDVDNNMKLAQRYVITNIPALLVLKDGEKVDMKVGFMPKEVLMEEFSKYM